ncbi:hypothetical protein GCM10009771_13060 [Nesterenkonia flava]
MRNHLENKFPLYLKHAQQRDADSGEMRLNPYPLVYNQGPAEAFWSLPRDEWVWEKDLGVMAPMADHTWTESQPEVPLSRVLTRLPDHRIRAMEAQRRMEQGKNYAENPRRKIATHIATQRADGILQAYRSEYDSALLAGNDVLAEAKLRELQAKEQELEGTHWVHEVRTYVETAKGFSQDTFPVVKVMVDEFGGFVGRTPEPDAPMFEEPDAADPFAYLAYYRAHQDVGMSPATDFRQFAVDAAFSAMYTLSLANCRNVTLDEEQGRVRSRQLRKNLGPDGEKEHVYSVINLDRAGPGDSSTKGERGLGRLHFVRGHFKTYTEENKLLGQHVGTFFWSNHARGDRGNGEVQAHYEI